MALARSMSGPAAGGLSINTSSANSLFGSSPGTAPAAGGMFGAAQASKPLFGASTTTTAPQTGGLFGSTTGTTGGGLFGSTATAQPTQPQTGGLFGATSQPQASGLFGSSAAATTQPQTGGLFGSSTATAQPQTGGLFGASQPQQPQANGGLFSSLGASQNQATGGMFGASQQQNQGGGGLFGGLGNQNQGQNKSSLFGGPASQNQQPQQQGSTMFSGQQQNQQGAYNQSGSFVGGLTMGAANQMYQQQTVPGVRINTDNIRGTTRFEDLHEDIQRQIEFMDNMVQVQVGRKGECDAIVPKHEEELSRIPPDVEFCRRKLMGVESALATDLESLAHVRGLIETDAENAKLSFKAIDRLKLPPQYHTPGVWHGSTGKSGSASTSNENEARDIVGFFSATADELSSTLTKHQNHIKEIELHLRNVESSTAQQVNSLVAKRNGAAGSDEDAVRELAGALTEFEQGVLHVAGKVGATRESVQALQLGSFTGMGSKGPSVNGRRSGVY